MTPVSRIAMFSVLVLALAGGCAVPAGSQHHGSVTRTGTPAVPQQPAAPRQVAAPPPPAAMALVEQAERASEAGRHAEAAALLERALRIAPSHPVLWQNLAVVRYREGDYVQAEQLALRSNTLAGSYPVELRRRNWELIAVARELRGDKAGAQAARSEGVRLQEASTRR